MRGLKAVVAVWFGVFSVSGVGAQVPASPGQPPIEGKVPVFPAGEQYRESVPPGPIQPARFVAPTYEQLNVMPHPVEQLTVAPRPETLGRRLPAAFPGRDPERPVALMDVETASWVQSMTDLLAGFLSHINGWKTLSTIRLRFLDPGLFELILPPPTM